jgi:hypothetical protein
LAIEKNKNKIKFTSVGIACIVSVPFLLFGGFIILITISGLLNSLDSSGWPSVEGKITQSTVVAKRGSTRVGNSNRVSITHYPKVGYSFNVGKNEYTGNSISFINHGGKKNAEAMIKRFPVGKTVPVFYDPDDPRWSALETHFEPGTLIFPIIGLVICLIGLTPVILFTVITIWRNKTRF